MATAPVCLDDPAPLTWADCVNVSQVQYVEPFDLSAMDPAVLGSWWTAGFGLVLSVWLMAKVVSIVLEAIKRW